MSSWTLLTSSYPLRWLTGRILARLQTWTRREGNIRLSMDDGPPSRSFLDEDYDEDNEAVADDEPLAQRAQRLATMARAGPPSSKSNPPHNPSPTSPITPDVLS